MDRRYRPAYGTNKQTLNYCRGTADRATSYVSKFVLFHEVWELEKLQTAKLSIFVQCRLVSTDRETDRQTHDDSINSIASRGKNEQLKKLKN